MNSPASEWEQIGADLARYYDQDASARAARTLPAERVSRRETYAGRLLVEHRHDVLDVGCGPGLDALALATYGLSVRAIDLSPEHVRLASEGGIDAQVAPVQQLPFPDDSFDAIWCMSVLMHLPDPDLDAALAEMARVLKPGGIAAIGTWGGADTEGLNPGDTMSPPRYFSWRSDNTIRHVIEQYAVIDAFETWRGGGDRDFTYQWCVAVFD